MHIVRVPEVPGRRGSRAGRRGRRCARSAASPAAPHCRRGEGGVDGDAEAVLQMVHDASSAIVPDQPVRPPGDQRPPG